MFGVAIDTGADAGEGDAPDTMLHRQLQGMSVATFQQGRLSSLSPLPDGTNGVDDIMGRQIKAAGDLRLTSGASTEWTAGLQQRRSGRAMDRPIHPSPTKQGVVGGIDDCLDLELGDIAVLDLDHW